MGLPTVIFYKEGLFDQYDYWAGTVSLVVFAFLETILFSYIFGIKKGWAEINRGADIKIPGIYKYIILIVTPLLLGWVLVSSIPDWIDKVKDADTNNKEWFAIHIMQKILKLQELKIGESRRSNIQITIKFSL